MSKLYSSLESDAIKTVHTARGHRWIKAQVQTWSAAIRVEIDDNGKYSVDLINLKTGATQELASGEVEK